MTAPAPGTRVMFETPLRTGVGTVDGPPFLVGEVQCVRLVLVELADGAKASTLNVPVRYVQGPAPAKAVRR